MPNSFSTVATANMELSPCRVTFKGVDLGGTLKNVVVRTEYDKADILADQSGTTVRDRRVSGLRIQVETVLAEIRNKDIWKAVFPHAREVTSGPNKQMYFENDVGDSDLLKSGILLLHPLSLVNADLSGDFKFFKATADAKSEYVFSPTEQAALKIIWNILPDDSVLPERFLIHGDPTIGMVAPTVGAPSFVGTGNGTLTGAAVYPGFTRTESIIATCVTAVTNGGVFEVHGTLSGPLGLATVGVGFVAPADEQVISFTINDGSTDFVVGDQFTLATVAGNYV
jgi:hypothetical protein